MPSKSLDPEAFSGPASTRQGLLLLETCGNFGDATHRTFTAAFYDPLVRKRVDFICGLVSEQPRESFDIRSMTKRFLAHLYDMTVSRTPSLLPGGLLEAFHGILLLFMIRSTLRSILQYSRAGFTSFGHQAYQDHSFEQGVACTLYQPMLAILETSKMTFGEMLRSESSAPNTTTDALYASARVISIPDPMNANPLEHILFLFKQMFPTRRASTWKGVDHAARKPSAHLGDADPLTFVDPSTYSG